jgi:N-acetylglucosaminyl-diphospho-decaprenol L-rhamnosyltransferase
MRHPDRDGRMISAVVVTYDSAACVGGCIASVRRVLPNAELVVVDNGSRDETIRLVQAAAPHARLIESGKNLGFGRACNAGAEAAQGSHLLFLNPDVVVTAARHEELHTLLANRPFGLVAPALEGDGDRRRAEESWAKEYFAHTLETLRPREWRRTARHHRRTDATWVSGAMLLVSRKEFLELGGFDSRFFLYYEDRDLSRRYRDANLKVRTTGAVCGRHAAGTSSATDGLRAGPMAWSLLGWIQYICIHDGERTAWRAALATLTTLRVVRVLVHVLASLHWGRARRKARQMDELFRFLAEQVSGEGAEFCPDALRVIRGLA